MNAAIRITPVRVVADDGEMLGEMPTEDALRIAGEAGMDLVEVSPEARPPVCRIMDYGKVQYDRKKKQSTGAKQSRNTLKQIRLRAKTGQHDIDFKIKKAREFLERKNRVKVNVQFRGRENAHHERGREMLVAICKTLDDVANIEKPPTMESGRLMSVMLAPKA